MPSPTRCTLKPASDCRSCAIRNGESSNVSATRVTSAWVRRPYSAHHRPLDLVKRALTTSFAGVMLSNGVPANELLSSGLTPSVMVPRVNAAAPVTVSTPGRNTIGAAAEISMPVMRTSP